MRTKVERAALAWQEARLKACAAPLGDKVVWTDLGAAETALNEAVRAMLEQEAEWERHLARPKLFVIHGKMHFSDHEEHVCTLDEAIEDAAGANEWGTWYPEGVRTISGEVVLTEKQLYDRIHDRD